MNFYSVRDLRTETKSVWETLSKDGEAVITINGKPKALMVNISNDNFEETVKILRQAKAIVAFNSIRKKVALNHSYMTDEEIEVEIQAYRKEKRDASSY